MCRDKYIDDPSIPDDAILWRRIHPGELVPHEETGKPRPKSTQFRDSNDGTPMSVYLADIALRENRNPEDILANDYPGEGMVSFTAGFVRGLGLRVQPNPRPEEPAHAYVSGIGKKNKKIQRTIAKVCKILVYPADVD